MTLFPLSLVQAGVPTCHEMPALDHIGIASDHGAPGTTNLLKKGKAPAHSVTVPEGTLDSARITLERSECYGSCPSYAIELKGNGSASYKGNAFVLVNGQHSFDVSKASVQCLLTHFQTADFWSLRSEYRADITDSPTYRISLTIGGRTKTVVDYVGSEVGMPAAVTALEEEIDRVGGDRWVLGTGDTFPSLQKERFDFHSQDAATILANAVAAAPDGLIIDLIEAGVPVTGRMWTPWRFKGATAVASASRAGRTAIVRALIAKGAFSSGPPDIKEAALIQAAASGNPLVVAEILKYRPNVNAQDQEGDTALITVLRSKRFPADKAKIDLVGVVHLLLEAGADPNIPNKAAHTALFSASNADVVKLLLKAGARIDLQNKYGNTPLP